MGKADYLALGDWNARCSMCGAKFKASQLVRNWQGMYRCKKCNEPRHPQDYVKAVPDIQTPPWTQPLDTPTYIAVCGPNGRTAISDYAVANCAICDFTDPAFDPDGE